MIVPDKTRNWQFVSRVDGYVQKLHVTSPGELVEKDAPLLSIYSPDLLTSEREFVELLRMRDRGEDERRARNTAALDRIGEAPAATLERHRAADRRAGENTQSLRYAHVAFALPRRRAVGAGRAGQERESWRHARRGRRSQRRLGVGGVLRRTNCRCFKSVKSFGVTAKSYPGQKFEGAISLIDPFLDETKRTAKVRIDIPNPDFKLRPGMYVNAELGDGHG